MMPAGNNASPPPPPLTTPMLTGPSVTMEDPIIKDDPSITPWADVGHPTMPWIMFWEWIYFVIITPGAIPSTPEEEFTLTMATTVITPATPPSENVPLVVFITQDATGGRQITWGANVKNAEINIRTTALTYSLFQFIGRVDPSDSVVKWFAEDIPLTGQLP